MDSNNEQKSSGIFTISMWKYVIAILIIIVYAVTIIYFEKKEYTKDINQHKQTIGLCIMQIETSNIIIQTRNKSISDLRSELYNLKQSKNPDNILIRIIEMYISNNYPIIPDVLFKEIAEQIVVLSRQENVPPELLVGIIQVESTFNPMVISKKNARGLMQVMPAWTKKFGIKKVCDLHNIKIGIWAGIKVLKIHIQEQNGDLSKGLYYYVNKDKSYVEKVYNAMGKFVIFKSKSYETKKGEVNDINSTTKSNDTGTTQNNKG